MDRPPAARVTLLDGFALDLPGRPRRSAGADLPPAVQRLVAHLCLSSRPARGALAGDLWPEVPEEHAHGSLRSALWRLNKVAPGLVRASASTLRLAADVRVDVRDLDDWARRAITPSGGAGDVAAPDGALLGDLLPGWYDDWVLLERERLRQLRLQALEAVAVRLAAAGRHGEALEAAHAAVRAEPLRESAHRVVVGIHLAQGNVAEAVRAYEVFRTVLADELGVLPSALMTRLVSHVPRVRRALERQRAGRPHGCDPVPHRSAGSAPRGVGAGRG
ncbi:AfsR/SARP family transcriptional regulator [Geodermatophilus telluris]|uniref:AfsR/SARP family transcriptional regulator n=1 Tax=Geodermatophilus telluris TaxID=1190417 RepID=UPI000B823C4B|nr:BTAD domain-containing putative transcriptional regulator [Geodermatophilus telluris]